MFNKLTQILILTFIVGLFVQCSSQNKPQNKQKGVNTSVSNPNTINPSYEAKIESNTPDYAVEKTDLNYLQSLPIPEIWFVFNSQNESKTELPEDIKIILDNYWKKSIETRYETSKKLNKLINGQRALDKNLQFGYFTNKQENLILKQNIATPNGIRKISANEVSEIITHVNLAASEIIERAENIK